MKRETLQSVLPFVKEYAAGRGKHKDQLLSGNDIYTGNAIGAIVNPTGIKRLPFSSSYCYDGLNGGLGVYNPKAILLQLQPCPPDLDEEAYRHYLQWVLNYSPWRRVFVSKSINKVMKDGVVVVDAAAPQDSMIGGCIAIRQAWDNYARMPRYKQIGLWWDLVQKADPTYAFAIVSNILYVTDTGKIAKGIIHAGHSPICGVGSIYNGHIDNFVSGKVKDKSSPWNKDGRGNAWRIWQGGDSTKLEEFVCGSLASIRQGKDKINPFTTHNNNHVYDRSAVVDCLINEIPNMEKEIGV